LAPQANKKRTMIKAAILRSEVESALAGRAIAPFDYRDHRIAEAVSSGIAEIDSLAGGLPRGSLTEICGPPCSGRMSVLLAALAARTMQREACALVDSRDAFDPYSAEAAGIDLKNLLWVRCRNIDQSLRAADLILQAGGFGMVALDLSDIPTETARRVPLNAWFRFRRIVENTPTIFLLLEQESNARTCASLVLRLGMNSARWNAAHEAQREPLARLLDGLEVHVEVASSRFKPVMEISRHRSFASNVIGTAPNVWDKFIAKTLWGYSATGIIKRDGLRDCAHSA